MAIIIASIAVAVAVAVVLGVVLMFTLPQINDSLASLNAKLDVAIQNKQNQPPVVATQADLDAIGAGLDQANGKVDVLIAPPPAPANPA